MDLRGRFERHRRDNRFVAAALVVVLALLTLVYYFLQAGRDLPSALVTNKVLLFALSYANLLLIVVILFVLVRNLVKLWLERRRGTLGSKFKTRLVATYVGLALVPALVLFFYASQLLQGSIDRWFSGSLAEVLAKADSVAQALQQSIEDRDVRDAGRLARELASLDLEKPEARLDLARRLQTARAEIGADLVAAYSETDLLHAVVEPRSELRSLPEPGRPFLREVAAKSEGRRVLVPPGTSTRLLVGAAAAPGRGSPPAPPIVVVVGTLLDPRVAASSQDLIEAYQRYRQIEVQKSEFKTSYMLTFVLVTLLILLASSWLGLYLARRVMVPIQALADATRRVSSGNLDERIEVEAHDEMVGVVDSFNRMTEELRQRRAEVERSQRELTGANRRIAEERALVGTILDNVAAGVVSIDRDGVILTANGAALQLLRQRADAVVGRPVAEAWTDPERARLVAAIEELAAKRARGAVETSLVLGGERRTFQIKVTTLGETGGRIVVLEDLSELVKAQKLAAWSEAARRMAHEIKNPLTPIRLAAERILKKHEGASGDLGPVLEEGVDIIVREVGNLQSMVDEFSRYARMPGPQLKPTDVATLVRDVLALYRDVKPGIELSLELAPSISESDGPVLLDPEQIRRVLMNLIDNALEATAPPGSVRVAASRRDGNIVFVVADTGSGIRPETREKLFLPHFSTKKRGTGMGLAIVQRIVTDHNGTIRVDDGEPSGTIFTVTLPAG